MLQHSPVALAFGLVTSICLVVVAGQSTPPATRLLRVIGYYADWTAARYPLAEIPADRLTHVNYVRYWDDVAKVPWLYNATKKEWITYEDPQSMRLKGEYIVAQNLGGAMLWELSNDDGTLLDALRSGLGVAAPGK